MRNLLPGVMAELERLKTENKRLERENEDLRRAADSVGDPPHTDEEGLD